MAFSFVEASEAGNSGNGSEDPYLINGCSNGFGGYKEDLGSMRALNSLDNLNLLKKF